MDDLLCRELVAGIQNACERDPDAWEEFKRGEWRMGLIVDRAGPHPLMVSLDVQPFIYVEDN